MALRKGATLAVLAGQAHAMTLVDEATEGQRFRRRPINAFACFDRIATVVKETLNGAMEMEALWNGREPQAKFLELADIDAGAAAARIVAAVGGTHPGPATVEPIRLVGL